MDDLVQTRALAFYLPQFHPIPENDAWWGTGFTEWTNVVSARPKFKNHYQPRLPADLGFYDLRLSEVQEAQADLARGCGIDGFIYYHYWFHGRRLLNTPINNLLHNGSPSLPFALCWANETWSRRWNGDEADVLMQQTYSQEDDRLHIEYLLDVMDDSRYITIDDKPLLLIYRISRLPRATSTIDLWRASARRRGRQLFLCNVESFGERIDPRSLGLDASVEFAPQRHLLGNRVGMTGAGRLARKFLARQSVYRHNNVTRYADMVEKSLSQAEPDYRWFRCVTPSWDNSPRRASGARIIHGSTPALYEQWLTEVVRRSSSNEFLFINAWNEWAEGAYLEPDVRWGHAYLEATKRALSTRVPQSVASDEMS